jgi:glycosyltransferase involved in cell wall biosynthesis
MRVLVDASVIAEGLLQPGRRKGIARASEELVSAVAARTDIALSLSAARSWQAVSEVATYAQRLPVLHQVPVVSASFGRDTMMRLSRVHAMMREHAASRVVRTGLHKLAALQARTVDRLVPPLTRDEIGVHDVFHLPAHWIPAITRPARTRYVVTIYDIIADTFPQFGNRWARGAFERLRRSIGPRDFIITDSTWVKEQVEEHWKIPGDRVVSAPLAASAALFYPEARADRHTEVRCQYAIPDGEYLLGVNRAERRKNLPHLVRAFVQMIRETTADAANLVLVGDHDWDPAALFSTPHDRDIARSRIVLTGQVLDQDFAAIYSGARAFVFPSLLEGFGLPALEAMQCGTPVITSNRSSLPEVVGDAAILVDPTDADALSAAMLNVLRDDRLRADLALRSLERAKQFTWRATADRVIQGYRAALEF